MEHYNFTSLIGNLIINTDGSLLRKKSKGSVKPLNRVNKINIVFRLVKSLYTVKTISKSVLTHLTLLKPYGAVYIQPKKTKKLIGLIGVSKNYLLIIPLNPKKSLLQSALRCSNPNFKLNQEGKFKW